ncbi:MAG: S-methyl-5-thioribose-1-phosphate isomerase [Candidatus Thermoplasmatota archaeon]
MSRSVEETVEGIRSMRVRGAAAIGVAAAKALADHVKTLDGNPASVLKGARKAARLLDAARPTAVSLHNALGWVLAGIEVEGTVSAMRKGARDAANLVSTEIKASRAAIAQHGIRLLKGADLVLTHCNSSTVVALLETAAAGGETFEVIATETRPFGQGLLTLKALQGAGIQSALVVDSAVEHMLATRDIDLVLVGGDTVARDGSLFNKIGTAGVAALAELHDVPFYAAVGLHKFTRRSADEVVIEERPAAEVVAPNLVPRGARVFNPVFDRTPPGRLAAYVTEQGLATPRKAIQRNLGLLPPEAVWG